MQPCPRERQTAVGGALSCKRLEAVIGHLLGENHLVCRVVELGPCPSSATDDLHSLTRSLLSIFLRKLLIGFFLWTQVAGSATMCSLAVGCYPANCPEDLRAVRVAQRASAGMLTRNDDASPCLMARRASTRAQAQWGSRHSAVEALLQAHAGWDWSISRGHDGGAPVE